MDEIKAVMLSVRWRNPERSWLIATMRNSDTKEVFTATGDIPYSETEEPVQLYGEWEDGKYGRQFKVNTAHRILPTDLRGLTNYLAASEDIKGVGPVRAAKLAEHFGSRLLRILDNEPNKLSECPGISVELAGRIASGWRKDSAIRQLSLYIARYGMSPRWAGRILQQWDAGTAVNNIKKNPYSLTAIEGIGFTTADELALAMGWDKKSSERTQAACIHVLQENIQNGNVFMHEGELIEEVLKIVHPKRRKKAEGESKVAIPKDSEEVRKELEKVIANKDISVETVTDGFLTLRLLYLPWMLRTEKRLAERIAELNAEPHVVPKRLDSVIESIQGTDKITFSPTQLEAIRGAFSNHFMVVTGGPGTGKTTCVRAICEVAECLDLEVHLCAPTGRAAKRLSEVTGRSATTIHRLLKWNATGPTHNSGNPLSGDVLIVDESSMLDMELADKLLDAVPNTCSVVFIGDVDQLPAVGAGTTLRDIIRSKSVPTCVLPTVFRQAESSLIVRNAHLIKNGENPRFPESKGSAEDSHVIYIPRKENEEGKSVDDAEWACSKLSRLVGVNIPEKFKDINPIRDVQVLVPMKKHTLGAHELNRVLQKALNPNGKEFFANGRAFRIGDRVIQMRNNYDEGMDVYNGDIGFIKANLPEDKVVEVEFDGRRVEYPYMALDDLQLGYALTVHKAQGSEYPVTVIVLGFQHWPMLERNLLYTANTRARKMCLYLASKGTIERAVKNNPVKERNTYLAQRLRALTAKEEASV